MVPPTARALHPDSRLKHSHDCRIFSHQLQGHVGSDGSGEEEKYRASIR